MTHSLKTIGQEASFELSHLRGWFYSLTYSSMWNTSWLVSTLRRAFADDVNAHVLQAREQVRDT